MNTRGRVLVTPQGADIAEGLPARSAVFAYVSESRVGDP